MERKPGTHLPGRSHALRKRAGLRDWTSQGIKDALDMNCVAGVRLSPVPRIAG
jgi:hypothetical protein